MESFLLLLVTLVTLMGIAWLLLPRKKLIIGALLMGLLSISFTIIQRKKGSVSMENKISTRSRKSKKVTEYKNKAGVVFREGDEVTLSPKAFTVKDPAPPLFLGKPVTKGKIVTLFEDVKGLVLVEPRLGGFSSWDVNDLNKVLNG